MPAGGAMQAAESGDAVSQYVLGACFKAGRGVSVNYPKVRLSFRAHLQWWGTLYIVGC